MPDKVPLCPECGKASIEPRGARQRRHPEREDYDPDKDYRCRNCEVQFNVPDYGERQKDPGPPPEGSLVRKLHEADPDDLGGGSNA